MERDASYFAQWEACLERCLGSLEPGDVEDIRSIAGPQDVRDLMARLQQNLSDPQPLKHAASMILPALEHLEVFNDFFMANLGPRFDASVVWGMQYIVIKLAVERSDSIRRIAEMIKKLGQKVELFNEYTKGGDRLLQTSQAALDVQMELASFFTYCIRFFRLGLPFALGLSSTHWEKGEKDVEAAWDKLMKNYMTAQLNIDEIYQRIDRLTQIATRSILREDFKAQQELLSSPPESSKDATLPCIILPPARSASIYNRDSFTDQIDRHLFPPSGERMFRSIVLYGMGGVGKSHVALKYAHLKTTVRSLDAVLWLHSETRDKLSQSFTEAALALGLAGVAVDRPKENRVHLLNWLQRTNCTWLLIFDNAEDPDVLLPYWPQACSRGSILVTSRNQNLQFGPADKGIEVTPFNSDSGSKLLFHLLHLDIAQDITSHEGKAALELSHQLEGHALAISFMAGLIQKRSWSIQEFLSIYEQNKSKLHGKRSPNALSTIWKLSFESLSPESATLLGIIAYINRDSVAEELFTKAEEDSLPSLLREYANELDFYDVVEPLLTLALVKRDKATKAFSTHSLVQTQYRYSLDRSERQKAFDQAVKLMAKGFGRVDSQLYDRWAQCQMYMQHILSLLDNYEKERREVDSVQPTVQFCSLLADSSRFLVETANYRELEHMVTVAIAAYEQIQPSKDDMTNIHTTILGSTGLLWGHRGYFNRALPYVRECKEIQSEREPKAWNSLCWAEVNLGNVTASAGRYQEALECQLRAVEARKQIGGDEETKPNAILQQNVGRCYTFLSQFDKAEEYLLAAMQSFEGSKNWAMLAFTLFAEGNLERRRGNLEKATSAYSGAQNVWIEGGRLTMHHFNGACLYKLGCLSDELGDADKAMKYLRDALVIVKLKKTEMAGDYARVLHKLSGLLKKKGSEVEGIERETEAVRIRVERSLSVIDNTAESVEAGGGNSAGDTRDVDEKPYDDLVYILWR